MLSCLLLSNQVSAITWPTSKTVKKLADRRLQYQVRTRRIHDIFGSRSPFRGIQSLAKIIISKRTPLKNSPLFTSSSVFVKNLHMENRIEP